MWIDDQVLKACALPLASEVWIPTTPMVVLGRGNKVEKEVNVHACVRDGIPILKRLGGGGTVLLHSGCLIVSLGLWVKEFYANDRYFRLLNQSVIDCLNVELPQQAFDQRGHSDIVQGHRKVAGTSLFRSRNFLLYQASILVDMQIDWIEKYLAHPSLEPDYRQGRRHRDFLTDLGTLGQPDVSHWHRLLQTELPGFVERNFAGERIPPQDVQIPHVLSRIGEEWLKPEEIQAALSRPES
jgi:lipoate-protein ligase A